MLCCLLAGLLLGLGLGLPAGLLMSLFGRDKPHSHRVAGGMGLVAMGLAAWYFWPMGLGLLQRGNTAAGLAGLAVPIGFAGTAHFNARHWLRKREIGWEPRVGWFTVALGLSLLLALLNAYWLVQRPRGGAMALSGDPNVLLVTIDTLRRDHLGVYGEEEACPTPHFDALAAQGVLYTDAITPLPETGPSHASMFTALHPARHKVLSNSHQLQRGYTTLAERLADEGYETAAFVSSFAVDSRSGLDQGFVVYDDEFFPTVHGFSEIRLVGLSLRLLMRFGDPLRFPFLLERSARATNERVFSWLDSRQERPFFCWVHYFEPHAPYEAHPDVQAASATPDIDHRHILANEEGFTYTPEVVEGLRALYRQEVTYADARLGDLLQALEDRDLAEDTLVIVTADHGEMLGEHGYHFNHHSIFDEALRIPLAIRAPGLRAGTQVVDAQVRVMDLPATVLDYLKLDPMEPSEGVELLGYAETVRHISLTTTLIGRKTGSLDTGSLFGLRTGRPYEEEGSPLKYILDMDQQQERLYNLEFDPEETEDLTAEHPNVVQQSRAVVSRDAESVGGSVPEVDASTREGLKALGYID